jgi:putative ABC transport system substrate-binding protein
VFFLRALIAHTIFATHVQRRAGGLVIGNDAFFVNQIAQIAALTVLHAVPTIFQTHEFAAAGGLISYGTNLRELFRQVGVYTGRMLEGERPADMPVQQATKVELISTSRPPRHSASRSHSRCSAAPTR